MDTNDSPPQLPLYPTPAHYKAVLDKTTALTQSFSAGKIDAREFYAGLNAVQQEARALNLLRKMNRTMRNLAAELAKEENDQPDCP